MAHLQRAALAAAVLAAAFAWPACRGKAPAPAVRPAAENEVAAEIGGEKVWMAEVDRRVLETYARDQMFDLRKQVLDQVLAERLIEREAKARGLSPEDLLKREVEAKAPAVTDQDVAVRFAESNLAGRGGTLEQFRGQIEKSLRDRALQVRRAGFMEELRAKADVKVLLKEPRLDIAVPADAPALGPARAPVTVVEFLDYQCPACHQVQTVVDQMLGQYAGRVRFVHRDFPLEGLHPQAMKSARAARCAGEQGKFWEYHRSLLLEQGHQDADLTRRAGALKLDAGRFESCVASDRNDAAIRGGMDQGREVGVNATPTFFINGRRIVGGRSLQDFKKVIDEELARS